MLRYLTSGESHGKSLVAILEGIPSNLNIDIENINKELSRRQQGYGRGERMKIEKDKINILSGIRGNITIGSPIAIEIKNKDYENWEKYMKTTGEIDIQSKKVTKARPGHADLVGALKYDFEDIRNVLERASARETAARVAVGAICKEFLSKFNIDFTSHVVQIGKQKIQKSFFFDYIKEKSELSQVRCVDENFEKLFIEEIKKGKEEGDSLGGVFEIIIKNVPLGLGSYAHYDKKLDSTLSAHLMSIQGIKGVEFGIGFEIASLRGSVVQDEIYYSDEEGIYRKTNNLGGIEGGVSTGEEIIIRCVMKPIPTLYKPLNSIDINTLKNYKASIERSDNCAVPAASVVAENVCAFVIAKFFLDKFSGDNMNDIITNYKNYIERLESRGWKKGIKSI
ncbi:chorismate synthase [Tepidibacter formicigenes]|uniref:Chorismate synthase n=1 Tax=Tepidibacter formicigenes DSM 15518 TaxID=1123349 RepID=A0A1M6P591_9FIRM|nr:chorismate synthase [Tepidibacter formicigenes]SHK03073.1 chorismate synthase [Tepidibacter formicigenes DSM 15518]